MCRLANITSIPMWSNETQNHEIYSCNRHTKNHYPWFPSQWQGLAQFAKHQNKRKDEEAGPLIPWALSDYGQDLFTCISTRFTFGPPSIHLVFHVSLLKPATTSEIPGHHINPPPPIEIDSESEFEVSEVLNSCIRWRYLEYLITWKGYENTTEASMWEPSKNISNATWKLSRFHAKNPTKPHQCPWEPCSIVGLWS